MTCKKEFLRIARRAVEIGLQSSTGGNISMRCGDRFLVKGKGCSFYDLKESEISIVDVEGNNLFDTPNPSKEIHFHLGVYRTRDDVCGVVHYHAPFSTAHAVKGVSIPLLTVHAKRILKKIPILPEAAEGSQELAGHVINAFSDRDVRAILLAGHGLVTVGSTLSEAEDIAELVEESAKISLFVRLFD
ncbi:MAG: class II aldolase/adducin family protein [Thermodesulfobacteriota bacterium]